MILLSMKCFIISCVTYCQELVATPGGWYKYTDPYPVSVDYACLEREIQTDYFE